MWVSPEHRGHGIAAALVAAVVGWADRDGAREVTAATVVYRRAGFAPTGRRQPLPSNPAVSEEEWVLTLSP